MEQTLVLIKPEAVSKSLTGNIITKLSELRLEIVALKCVRVSKELAEAHYRDLKERPFFEELITYIMGGAYKSKVFALVYRGDDAIKKIRTLAGATNPEEADAESIRGKYGRITTAGIFENVIHASSDIKEAEREIKLWFTPEEIIYDIYPTKTIDVNQQQQVWM